MGCRNRRDRTAMFRFQLDDGLIRRTDFGRAAIAGRSVYICRCQGCLDAVLKRGVLVFRNSKYAKIIVRLNDHQAQRLARAFRGLPAN